MRRLPCLLALIVTSVGCHRMPASSPTEGAAADGARSSRDTKAVGPEISVHAVD
jgi:hypothetical protein